MDARSLMSILSFVAAVAGPAVAQDKQPPRVELQMELKGEAIGKIVIELDEAKAPITVKNFLTYVDEGYYDGTIFHRIMPNFMIQGGGYTADFNLKKEGLHKPIENEAKNGLKNARGTVAMARGPQPHSATAQFFINVVDNDRLNYPAHDGWGYCVFGKVVEGMDVVDKIRAVPTKPKREIGGAPAPLDPPVIKKARRVKAEDVQKKEADEPKKDGE